MLKTTLASLILASSLVACADRAPQVIAIPTSADIAKPGAMVVNGSATLEVSPDCADLTMTIYADGVRPGVATSAAQAKEQKIIDALKSLGLEASDLKVSYMTLNPIYYDNPDGWQNFKVRTYQAEITITATTKQFDKIAGMMDAASTEGARSISTQFRRSDMAELKKKVRAMALAAAKDKAKQTADTLGISLGRVVSVAENPGGMMWGTQYFPNFHANAEGAAPAPQAAVTLGGALQPLTLDITIGYELDAKV